MISIVTDQCVCQDNDQTNCDRVQSKQCSTNLLGVLIKKIVFYELNRLSAQKTVRHSSKLNVCLSYLRKDISCF